MWQRFCSGDLAKTGAYYYRGLGTRERIYLNGEEISILQNGLLIDQGRAWARVATGKHSGEAIELPRLGRMGFENAVASPFPQEKTIVALLDDSSISTAPTVTNSAPSEVYFYIGRKTTQRPSDRGSRADQRQILRLDDLGQGTAGHRREQ